MIINLDHAKRHHQAQMVPDGAFSCWQLILGKFTSGYVYIFDTNEPLAKEIQIIHRLFLVIAMYCQASSSQLNESINLSRCQLAGKEAQVHAVGSNSLETTYILFKLPCLQRVALLFPFGATLFDSLLTSIQHTRVCILIFFNSARKIENM